jgi:hypothetical protein
VGGFMGTSKFGVSCMACSYTSMWGTNYLVVGIYQVHASFFFPHWT